LEKFFRAIERKSYLLVWEPRGKWERKGISSLCEKLDLVPCVDPFKNEPFACKTGYFRLHGKTGYRYKYTDSDLGELAKKAQSSLRKKDYNLVYFMFNNVYMFEDALRFQEMMKD
jgi:uncharacterized protein YecE (DUF72 family)